MLLSASCLAAARETRALLVNVPGRLNVIGLMNRDQHGYFHTVEGTVTHATVIETIVGFIRQRTPEKLTILVMDNASVYKKAVKLA